MTPDPRVVYGARCVWWDTIGRAGATATGLPCCPHCSSPLLEVPDLATWWSDVDRHEAAGHPGYRNFIKWMRGRCYPDHDTARTAYLQAHGS